MTSRPHSAQLSPRIAALLPAEERFDGRGGAIATWVRDVYSQIESSVIYCPEASPTFAGSTSIVCPFDYNAFNRTIQLAAKLIAPIMRRPWLGIYFRLLLGGRLWVWRNLRSLVKIQVVHLHNRPRYALWLRHHGYQGQILLHMHNDLAQYVSDREFLELHAAVDRFVFCSEFLLHKAKQDFGLPFGEVIYNCVDTSSEFGSVGAAKRGHSLAFVGRLVPEKGALEAIRVCHVMNQEDPRREWSLDIFGGPTSGHASLVTDYTAELARLAADVNRAAGREMIRIRGHVSRAQLANSLSGCAYFLYPCQWDEPFGMVLIEAMALGLIPIASRRGGIPEIIDHRVNGILVESPTDEYAFAREILSISTDDVLADQLRRAAVATAAKYSPGRAARALTSSVSAMMQEARCAGSVLNTSTATRHPLGSRRIGG